MNYRFWKRAGIGPLLFPAILLAVFPVSPERSLANSMAEGPLQRPALGTYTVIALRVEFAPDDSRYTTGTGRFGDDLFGGIEASIDPLPHDAGYFNAHLEALRRYVRHASGGRAEIEPYLVPEVVRLAEPMSAYSPIGEDITTPNQLGKLAKMSHEAWSAAASLTLPGLPDLDPERTFFLLFHAGAGRDIELIGTSLDKTPEDLPSLFLPEETLRLTGEALPRFGGIDVTHCAVAPETESRLGTDPISGTPYLLELGMNGLVASLFFNFLKVPDLFNTSNGESAIGPFGLMDPQGIFAYFGLLPPMPSAWSRYYLGWLDVAESRFEGPESFSLPAQVPGALAAAVQVLISDSEYFLVENRQRDPAENGLTLEVWQSGVVVPVHFDLDDTSFSGYDVSGFPGGVLLGADDYDWALPGSRDENGSGYDGGILIWHVDDYRIRAGLANNSVNADPDRRGVDLEEADGAQDIGYPPRNPFAPRLDLGTAFDFWYKDNPASAVVESGRVISLYANRFGPDTRPSSANNAGGATYVVIDDFSESGAVMEFTVRRESQGVPAFDGKISVAAPPEDFSGLKSLPEGPASVAVALYLEKTDGGGGDDAAVVMLGGGSAIIRSLAPVMPAVTDSALVVAVRKSKDSGRRSISWIDLEAGEVVKVVALPERFTEARFASPVVLAKGDGTEAALAFEDAAGRGGVVQATFDGQVSVSEAPAGDEWFGVTSDGGGGFLAFGRFGAGNPAGGERVDYALRNEDTFGFPVAGRDAEGLVIALALPSSGELLVGRPDREVRRFSPFGSLSEHLMRPFVVPVDLDLNGTLDFLCVAGSSVTAVTEHGAVLAGFPATFPAAIVGQPLVVRWEGDTHWSLLVQTEDGYVHAFPRAAAGLPVATGAAGPWTPVLARGVLTTLSRTGWYEGRRMPELDIIWWGELFGDRTNGAFVTLDSGSEPPGKDLLVPSETYVWPNPAREGESVMRLAASRDCRVRISVIDLAGQQVGEFELEDVRAGEIREIRWTHQLGSGLYYARYVAEGTDGSKESRLVKIAVIQ